MTGERDLGGAGVHDLKFQEGREEQSWVVGGALHADVRWWQRGGGVDEVQDKTSSFVDCSSQREVGGAG